MDRESTLVLLLEEARALGFLGPEPVERHIRHARTLATRVDPPSAFFDLGSGAGVPGLVLALVWPDSRAILFDASARRSAFCERAVVRLALRDRITVVRGRAEEGGRDDHLREQFHLVVARSFARPAVTVECGAPFVRPGGCLLVSEPPNPEAAIDRWPPESLAELGLGPAAPAAGEGVSSVLMAKLEPIADRFPRRVGVPAKRPLWS